MPPVTTVPKPVRLGLTRTWMYWCLMNNCAAWGVEVHPGHPKVWLALPISITYCLSRHR
nr:hypothetical protein [uncultured bacterium]